MTKRRGRFSSMTGFIQRKERQTDKQTDKQRLGRKTEYCERQTDR